MSPRPGAAVADGARLRLTAGLAAIAVAATLVVVKLFAWLLTGSVSLLSSLVDSALDLFASLINLLAMRYALSPPDRGHRFGHGKAEPLAALAQVLLIGVSVGFVLVEAGRRLFDPQPLQQVGVGVAVMVFAVLLTFALTRFQRHVVRHTGSFAVRADSLHYFGDLLANVAVIAALLLTTAFGWHWADPLFATAIGLYILGNLLPIARGALDMLMDHELPEVERRRIKRIVLDHRDVLSLHELKTRAAGPRRFIQVRVVMDGHLSLRAANRVSDDVQAALLAVYPDADVVIRQDPGDATPPRR